MSKLEYYSRPLVAFDPANKEHRRFFHEFLETSTWGRCPVRFICPDESGSDLVKMMQRQLIEYYIGSEFKESKPAKKKSTARKIIGFSSGGHGIILD
jgi:hypothetical protein